MEESPGFSLVRQTVEQSPGSSLGSKKGSPGSGRKPQPTLEALWGLSGPQVSQHRSPEWLLEAEKWKQEEASRKALAREAAQSRPGDMQVAPLQKPHSGGRRGGRPASGRTTGVAVGQGSNRRPMGAAVLRRDPSLAQKMAIVGRMASMGSEPGCMASHVRRQLEQWSGFSWKRLVQWYKRREEFESEFSRLRLGLHGIRPFGSRQSGVQRPSVSKGCRLRGSKENYQSGVFRHLKQWFEAERMYGHTVSRSLLKEFYLRFLEREVTVKKAKLLQLAGRAAEEQGEMKQLALVASAEELALQPQGAVEIWKRAKSLQSEEGTLRQEHFLLQKRIRRMQSAEEQDHLKYMQFVAMKVGAQWRKPQRKTRLDPSQEFERVRLTWESFDRAQYVAVSGSDEELLEQVPDPKQWRDRLPTVVLVVRPMTMVLNVSSYA